MDYFDKLQKQRELKPKTRNGDFTDMSIYKAMPGSLNEIETQIEELKNKTWECAWHIGKRLITIREKYLTDSEYHNIYEYSELRFGLSKSTVYNFIFLAERFELFQTIGKTSKLLLLRKLPSNLYEKYLEWINADDPTVKEIQERIKAEYENPSRGRPKKPVLYRQGRFSIDPKLMGLKIDDTKARDFIPALEQFLKDYFKE